jgi:hypothetical protein
MPAISLPDVGLPARRRSSRTLPSVKLPSVKLPSDVEPVTQLAQELSIAALLGGNLYGRMAMHPALGKISDPRERGIVLNSSWRRYGLVNSLGAAGLLAGWLPARRRALSGLRVSKRDRALIGAKDVAIGAVILTGFASALGGIGFAHTAPDGAVPLRDGTDPGPETPRRAARLKRAINVLGRLNLAAETAFVALDAALVPRRPRWALRR